MEKKFDIDFYRGKKVFITGHTGFKGSWLCKILLSYGAYIKGYSLTEPPTVPSLFTLLQLDKQILSDVGDIQDYKALKNSMDTFEP